jgi:regulator of nucleoside diphosphate kinase
MIKQPRSGTLPSLVVSEADYDRLFLLAERARQRTPEVADGLLAELDRARIVDDAAMPADVVRMGSGVRFVMDGGEAQDVVLVFPGEADIAQGRISILTPVGMALIGLSKGQRIAWTDQHGRGHELVVRAVRPPAAVSAASPA